MSGTRLLGSVVLVSLLILSVTGVGVMAQAPPREPTAVFLSDDRDPLADDRPPFALPEPDDFGQFDTMSAERASRLGDFVYATTQPSATIGPRQQTLQEYRYAQLQSIERTQSTSLWLPDSNRSNGTVVRDAHVTILGTQEGTQTRLNETRGTGDQRNTSDDLLFIPRNGTVLTHLDYATVTANETSATEPVPDDSCTVSNGTKTCVTYTVTEQTVDQTLRIGSQSWQADGETPHQLEYSNATATEPTDLVVEATIESAVTKETTTYTRTNGEWQPDETVRNETTLSQTVEDRVRVVVTTNQELSVTQTLVESDGDLTKIALQFDGPATLTDRRLWSSARFDDETGRLTNIWGMYSQRSEPTATRGSYADTDVQREQVPFPNVLELQLIASRSAPSLTMADDVPVQSRPEVSRIRTVRLADEPAPLDPQVRLPSNTPTTPTSLVITNAEQPITTMRDIHGDPIAVTTQTASERAVDLEGEPINETHARFQLTDAHTGEPLSGRTLWLDGAAHGTVTTNGQGIATVERRDLYVTVSFPGATNVSGSVYYDSAQTQLAFQPEPFNIYQLLSSLAGAIVSIGAFLIFFLPFAYLRR